VAPLKQHNTQSKITLEIFKHCSSNMAPAMCITKEPQWYPSCRCHDNSYAAGSVLITAKISRFYLKQVSSSPTNLMGRVRTIWEPRVFQARPSGPLLKVANGDICFFTRKRLEPRVLPWTQHRRCHYVYFVMNIAGAKFEEHCLNISRVILD